MTREEAKRRMEICRDFLANNYSDMGEPNFTAFEMAIQALEKENIYDDKEHYVTISKALYDKLNIDYEQALSQEPKSPCDLCIYSTPSSMDGKPCTMCPAEGRAK